MSEDRTIEMRGAASFEERVFARFDAIDRQFADMRERVERLQARAYDTKPIWEQALAALLELRQEIRQIQREVRDIIRTPDVLNKNMLQKRVNSELF